MVVVRNALGVIVGAVLWFPVFFTLAWLLTLVWPAYAVDARAWMESQTFSFAPAMAVCNVVFWIASEVAVGGVAVLVARRREAAWVLAALVMGYLCYVHLYAAWSNMPWWYNLLVALPSGPAVVLGGRLAARFARAPSAVAAPA